MNGVLSGNEVISMMTELAKKLSASLGLGAETIEQGRCVLFHFYTSGSVTLLLFVLLAIAVIIAKVRIGGSRADSS